MIFKGRKKHLLKKLKETTLIVAPETTLIFNSEDINILKC